MKEYSNGEIIVCWDPDKCMHASECVRGLPHVFDRKKRPWVNMQGANSEEITKIIDRCPSGALSYKRAGITQRSVAHMRITRNGPILVEGKCSLTDQEGNETASYGPFALCRCGGSRNKPFCDGTHIEIGFDDSK